jgi:hypothetical protein
MAEGNISASPTHHRLGTLVVFFFSLSYSRGHGVLASSRSWSRITYLRQD